jgi:hypothetical protein
VSIVAECECSVYAVFAKYMDSAITVCAEQCEYTSDGKQQTANSRKQTTDNR